MTQHFIIEIAKLKKQALRLSALVEENLSDAVRAIDDGDKDLANQVVARDRDVDAMEIEIEEECLKTLALHQPVAKDLRLVVAVLKMNNELERIGDLAVNIAERALCISGENIPVAEFDFKGMAGEVQKMLKKALDAVCSLNADLAREVCVDDDKVDEINKRLFGKVKSAIAANPGEAHIDTQINLLSVSRHLERIADHATNIAEDLIYLIEGRIVRHHSDV